MKVANALSVADWTERALLVAVLVALSGCGLTGEWTVSDDGPAHRGHHAPREPAHYPDDGKFALNRCRFADESRYCFAELSDGFEPLSGWVATTLVKPTENQIEAIEDLEDFPSDKEICRKNCVIGDFRSNQSENHILLLDEVSLSECDDGKRCFEILLFCADACSGGVQDLENKTAVRIQHLGSGHAHKH